MTPTRFFSMARLRAVLPSLPSSLQLAPAPSSASTLHRTASGSEPGRALVHGKHERFNLAHGSAKVGTGSGKTLATTPQGGKRACRRGALQAIIRRFSQNIFRRSAYPSIQFLDRPIHVPCASTQAELQTGVEARRSGGNHLRSYPCRHFSRANQYRPSLRSQTARSSGASRSALPARP